MRLTRAAITEINNIEFVFMLLFSLASAVLFGMEQYVPATVAFALMCAPLVYRVTREPEP